MSNPLSEKLWKQPLLAKIMKSDPDMIRILNSDTPVLLADLFLRKLLNEYMGELLPYAAKAMKVSQRRLASLVKGVIIVDTPSINARLTRDKSTDSFNIEVYWGLMKYFHFMSSNFFARVAVGFARPDGVITHLPKEPTIPFDQVCRHVKQLFVDFFRGDDRPVSDSLTADLNDGQEYMSALVLHYMESFVLAHELGHIAALISPREASTDVGRALAKEVVSVLRNQRNKSAASRCELVDKWGQEMAADHFALRLIPNLGKNNFERMMGFTSIELALILFNMLELFFLRTFKKEPPIDMHPPSALRLHVLRLAVGQSNPPELLQLGEDLEKQALEILDEVCPE